MTFDLRALLVFVMAALVYGLLPVRWRGWMLLGGSVVAAYWLQPGLPIRFSDFILPTVTIMLTVGTWWFTRPAGTGVAREDRAALALVAGLIVALSFMRFVDADFRLTASRPPEPLLIAIGLVISGTVFVVASGGLKQLPERWRMTLLILVVVVVFALLKTDPLATTISGIWRGATGQDVTLASAFDLNWLGFSYVAFRLIHTLRDRQTGILPTLTLREFVTYAIFFPSYTAGPIDRAERFVEDLRAVDRKPSPPTPLPQGEGSKAIQEEGQGTDSDSAYTETGRERTVFNAPRATEAVGRITMGLFKKFVIADLLAAGLALNTANVGQVTSAPGLWLLLYGYALRLFFDFSGYTDMAIGVGLLFGVKLPENFDRPYLKTNITSFWQSWHMTLSNWARFYIFSPFSRWMLTRKPRPPMLVMVLAAQAATMVVIGLWHGVTVNFVVWGLWHGVGLFVHKVWSDRTRKWYRGLDVTPGWKRAWTALAWLVTVHYVVIGWLWFALPETGTAARTLAALFGMGW